MESGRKEDGTTGKGSDSVGKDRKRVPAGVPLTRPESLANGIVDVEKRAKTPERQCWWPELD